MKTARKPRIIIKKSVILKSNGISKSDSQRLERNARSTRKAISEIDSMMSKIIASYEKELGAEIRK